MKMKCLLKSVFCVFLSLTLVCCKPTHDEGKENLPSNQIVILYDNDVHCAVDGYPVLVSYRNECLSTTSYVSNVSCGDFSSGGIVGAISKGEKIVDIMNYVEYDVVALGNHELDYGMQQMFDLTEKLDAPVVCANLKNIQTDTYLYPAYKMINYGDVDVAFIGFTTTSSGTIKSLNDDMGNPLYSFMRDEFYQNAQYFIDEARNSGADYVIALSHLGDTQSADGHPSSIGLINNTTGLDAVIDAHDHHVIVEQIVSSKDGKAVLLTSSGCNFQYIGQLTINTDGTISSSLISIANGEILPDNSTQQFVGQIKEDVGNQGNFVIGNSNVELKIYDADGNRIVRKQESNLGDFCADALRVFTDSDIALVNGGAIRAEVGCGEILFNDLYGVMPFGDMIATANLSGQQLLDVLEYSVSFLPEEAGVFMQVSGMKFEVNPNIPTPVVMDSETSFFSHIGNGERRVSNLKILDKDSGEFIDVDLSHQYTMASLDYLIYEMGGSGIFEGVTPDYEYWGADIEVLRHYLETYLGGVIDSEYEEPQGRIVFNR